MSIILVPKKRKTIILVPKNKKMPTIKLVPKQRATLIFTKKPMWKKTKGSKLV